MIKRIHSQAGFTITELMVVIAISGFLMAAAAIGFSTFFSKFEEMNRIMELQRDAFNCMQTIKNGIPIGSGAGLKFQGIATADSVKFPGNLSSNSESIILYPPPSSYLHLNDFIRIYREGRYVRATYLDGTVSPPSPLYLFPKPSRGVYPEVTKLRFSQANTDIGLTRVVNVELEARVLLKKDHNYYKNVYKTVKYATRMTLALR